MLRSRRRRLAGFTLAEVLTVSALMSGLNSGSQFSYALNKANEIKGLNNLRQIYLLLQTQCIVGGYPNAAFYPKGDPRKDPRSIVRLVQGAPPELFVSPFAPEPLKAKGLTYAWNDKVNGKSPDQVRRTWLLVDLAAFIADPKVPKPTKYLILYSDGRAVASSTLPADIVRAVAKARQRLSVGK